MLFVDVGASGGIHKRWLKIDCDKILFEPNPKSYKSLLDKYDDVRQIALGATKGRIDLNICRGRKVTSLLEPNREYHDKYRKANRFDIIEKIEVELDTLDNQVPNVDFLKIDTQGYDYQVLLGAKNQLDTIQAIEIEVLFAPYYKKQSKGGDIDKLLRGHGFKLHKLDEHFRDGPTWSNYLYYRDSILVEAIYRGVI